jgi:hypothetical protein
LDSIETVGAPAGKRADVGFFERIRPTGTPAPIGSPPIVIFSSVLHNANFHVVHIDGGIRRLGFTAASGQKIYFEVDGETAAAWAAQITAPHAGTV